jgi:hypothetical protein
MDSKKDGADDLMCSRSEVMQMKIAARNVSVAEGIEALVLSWLIVQYSMRTHNWSEA